MQKQEFVKVCGLLGKHPKGLGTPVIATHLGVPKGSMNHLITRLRKYVESNLLEMEIVYSLENSMRRKTIIWSLSEGTMRSYLLIAT